ncbi:YdiU family protein [Psychrosphaera haliotis]|uniref:protein adenylyltransferase SelO n=1 Tax=Psychrosphaera haliotis TaxID=555083 RepID=UPI0031E3C259
MSTQKNNPDILFNNTYIKYLPELGAVINPAKFNKPNWLITSIDTAELLSSPSFPSLQWLSESSLDWFAGKSSISGAQPFAQKYTGHQFGHYNPQLGDGRGVLLGEVESSHGRFDIHVKGAGQTPYSRFGDGRAVVRSSIREFLASEALHHLGIPTSRALGVFTTGEQVQRETIEQGAALIRVCPSHIRFGHFENAFHHGDTDLQTRLVEYCINHVLPKEHSDLAELYKADASDVNIEEKTRLLFRFTIKRTAEMVAKWQAHGFCHGVMNTDNMSILGLTFDYGPFGFLDQYNPQHICNHSDHTGRYAFDEQPGVALWNLNVLGHSLSGLLDGPILRAELEQYQPHLLAEYSNLMRQKMGFAKHKTDDRILLGELLSLMQENKADYSIVWRTLSEMNNVIVESNKFTDLFIDRDGALKWLQKYSNRLAIETRSDEKRTQTMQAINPKYILRNYLAQQVIEAAEQGDNKPLEELYSVLKRPYDSQPEYSRYAQHPPAWSEELSISCSS